MDHVNVHLYKDNDDLIVVFKNAGSDIETMIQNMLMTDVKTVPKLEKVEEPINEKPDVTKCKELKPDLEKYEALLPEFLSDKNSTDFDADIYHDVPEQDAESQRIDDEIIATINTESNNESIPVSEEVKPEEVADSKEINVVESNTTNEPTFSHGEYKGLTPKETIDKFGNEIFYKMAVSVYKNKLSGKLLDSTKKVIISYFNDNYKDNLRIVKNKSVDEISETLKVIYPMCKTVIDEKIKEIRLDNLEALLKLKNPKQIYPIFWKALKEFGEVVNSWA